MMYKIKHYTSMCIYFLTYVILSVLTNVHDHMSGQTDTIEQDDHITCITQYM